MTDRVLISRLRKGSYMTVQRCAQFCGEKGYRYFGVEYSDECVARGTLRIVKDADEE